MEHEITAPAKPGIKTSEGLSSLAAVSGLMKLAYDASGWQQVALAFCVALVVAAYALSRALAKMGTNRERKSTGSRVMARASGPAAMLLFCAALLTLQGCSSAPQQRIDVDVEHSSRMHLTCVEISTRSTVPAYARAFAALQANEWARRLERDLQRRKDQ